MLDLACAVGGIAGQIKQACISTASLHPLYVVSDTQAGGKKQERHCPRSFLAIFMSISDDKQEIIPKCSEAAVYLNSFFQA